MFTVSFSIIGRPLSSHDAIKSLRRSPNRVKPQSLSSALNLCCAAVKQHQLSFDVASLVLSLQWCRYIDGSFLFHITSVNCTHAYQPSCAFSSSSCPCSRYKDAWSTLLPNGKSNILLLYRQSFPQRPPGVVTDHGCPPHSNTGPRSFLLIDRQFSMVHVCSASVSISRSGVGICMRAFIASTYHGRLSACLFVDLVVPTRSE